MASRKHYEQTPKYIRKDIDRYYHRKRYKRGINYRAYVSKYNGGTFNGNTCILTLECNIQ